ANFITLVVATYGDRALLGDPKALAALAAKINKANNPKVKNPDPESQRRDALESVARVFGLAPEEVDKAIRAWGERTDDPFEKGLVALYERDFPLADDQLSKSREIRKKNFASAQSALADTDFFLGRSLYEEGKYREAVTIFREAHELRPKDSVVLTNLAVSLHRSGDYTNAEVLYRELLEADGKMEASDQLDRA